MRINIFDCVCVFVHSSKTLSDRELTEMIISSIKAQEERLKTIEKMIEDNRSGTNDLIDANSAVIVAKDALIATKDTVIEAMSSVIKAKDQQLKKSRTELFYLQGRLSVRGVIREMERNVDLYYLKPNSTRVDLWRSLLINNVNRVSFHLSGKSSMSYHEVNEWIDVVQETYDKASSVVNNYLDTSSAVVIDTEIFCAKQVRLVEGVCQALDVNYLLV